ncbi:M48 family metalloprotease [Candidatus Kaiserbacteria bacterium]|nr:M48 family metalloprotease [Candidatus Kaiserbacteria bacterium]
MRAWWVKVLLLFVLSAAIEAASVTLYWQAATGPLAGAIDEHTAALERGVIPPASEIDIENDPWVSVAHFESSFGQAITLVDLVMGILVALVFLFGGVSAALAKYARELSSNVHLSRALYFIFFVLVITCIDLPLAASGPIIEMLRGTGFAMPGYVIFGFFQELSISVIFTIAVFVPLYSIMDRFPKWWWAIGALFMSLVTAFTTFVGPVLIEPLYYELKPLESFEGGEIRAALVDVVSAADIPMERVYVAAVSGATFESNAMVVGLGATKRIVLDDTLIMFYTPREIRGIVAHETGHYVLGHLWIDLAAATVLTFVSFYILSSVLSAFVRRFGTHIGAARVNDVVLFPILGVVFFYLSLLISPATSALSRSLEQQADAYALTIANDAEASANGLRKLAYQSFVDVDPPPLLQFWFGTHPPLKERIQFFERSGAR